MKKILTYLFSLVFLISYSQEEASNWYFGNNAGIKFNTDGSVTSLSNGQLATDEGCATISDVNGDLLFYTDGITVWNRLHQPMSNANAATGTGLFGDPSSTQSAIIIPKPDDPNIYYIFTVDTSVRDGDSDEGFNYSIVDLSLNGGLGDITNLSKNTNLLEDSSEKISAVLKDCQTKSIWVITFASLTGNPEDNFNTFHAYEVSSTGVNTTPISTSFINLDISNTGGTRGYLKFSPDGSKIALANVGEGLYLFDFDTETGIVSNQTFIDVSLSIDSNINNTKPQTAYGLEFSPNNEFLYVSTNFQPTTLNGFENPAEQFGILLQYDITSNNINDNGIVLDSRRTYRSALQLAPNGKIYRSLSHTHDIGSPYLGVINNPNMLGTEVNYQHNAISLGRDSRQGLPPFITSFFSEKIDIVNNEISSFYLPLCIGDSYTLTSNNIPGATYTWTKDDILLPETDFDLEIPYAADNFGLYKVFIETSTLDCDNTFEGQALVEYFDTPIANQPDNITICDGNNDGQYSFDDFATQDLEILNGQDPEIYIISYHLSQEDADNNQNPIIFPYNGENAQEVFIRLGLNQNATCYDTSKSFIINIYNTPIANSVIGFTTCDVSVTGDLDVNNGQTDINLNQINENILGNQNATDYSITYYRNRPDAVNKNAPLPNIYYNETPFNVTIHARIENVLHDGCFDISEPINITVNPLPEFTNTTLIQCDDDNDDMTRFNLFEAEANLTNNAPNRSVIFFESMDNILTNTEIDNPTDYENNINLQIVYAKIIDTNTNCFDIAELTLQIATTQVSNYNATPVCDETNSEDGLNTFNLNDITAQIQLENSISLPISYYETYEDALLEENQLNASYNNTQPYSQTIFARVENNNACYGISEVLLTVNKLPELAEDITTFYCLNTYPQTISLNAGIESNINDFTYNWSNGSTNYETEINEIGIYTVEVTSNIDGCSKTRTITIESSDIAHFEDIPYAIVAPASNNTVTVFVSGDGIYEYALHDDVNNILYRDFQDNNVFENVYPGIYTINIKDIKNDCGIIYEEISVIGFPKYFTPNNDGINDTWQIIGVSNMFFPNAKIAIYNRLGKLIQEITPLGQGWNGLINGKKLPADDYWFSIKLQDGRIFKDHFTLKY